MILLRQEAKSEKEAADITEEILGIPESEFNIEVFKKGSGGFLGMGSKKPSVFHANSVKDKTSLEAMIKGVVISLLNTMGYVVEIINMRRQEDGKYYVEMASPQAGFIIGKKGKTLEALQFLVNVIIEKHVDEQPKILLDIENYRERRANQLSELARKTAANVLRSGRSRLLDPLNPYERRLVHMALQENDDITTESEGSGVYKRVRISARKGNSVPQDMEPAETEEDEIAFDDYDDPDSLEKYQAEMAAGDGDEAADSEEEVSAANLSSEENQNP